jgi:hypothetical protein
MTVRNAASAQAHAFEVDARQPFAITLNTPPGLAQGQTTWWLETPQAFVPATAQANSTDERALSFKVEAVGVEAV